MTHRGTERERQPARRQGSLADFLAWRAREGWPPLVIAWFFLPPASLIGAAMAMGSGAVTEALELLAIGAVPLIWLFLPVLTRRYRFRRVQPDL